MPELLIATIAFSTVKVYIVKECEGDGTVTCTDRVQERMFVSCPRTERFFLTSLGHSVDSTPSNAL